MTDFLNVLTPDEITVFTLRALYSKYGYSQYKMSKFEEYDLYVQNKNFLVSDNVITFTDTDGRLLALRPDVTLSIIKNNKDNPDELIKAQYNENVYRISGGTHCFGELMQVGLECIGKITEKEISEVLFLASKSLDAISEDNVLAISELDVAEGIMDEYKISENAKTQILSLLGQKNAYGITEVLSREGVSEKAASLLASLANIYGKAEDVISRLDEFKINEKTAKAIERLSAIVKNLHSMGAEKVYIDFSLVGDMKYYNGIAMKGFVEGIPSSIISGGQYDRLMRKMNKRSNAIGFAVYLDRLDRLPKEKSFC